MKEQFQKIEINHVISFLKTMNLYRKIKRNFQQDFSKMFLYRKYFKKIWSFPQAVPKKKNKKKKTNNTFLLQDDSLKINFQWNQIFFYIPFLHN